MGKRNKKIPLEGGGKDLSVNPFASLETEGLPRESKSPHGIQAASAPEPSEKKKNRGRVDVVRQRSAGSGGWMTVAKNFVGISIEEKNALKNSIQKRCGVGGTLKNGVIEIQGDKRDQVRDVLESAGFRVVFAGG